VGRQLTGRREGVKTELFRKLEADDKLEKAVPELVLARGGW
jgi:hypothetical protein